MKWCRPVFLVTISPACSGLSSLSEVGNAQQLFQTSQKILKHTSLHYFFQCEQAYIWSQICKWLQKKIFFFHFTTIYSSA